MYLYVTWTVSFPYTTQSNYTRTKRNIAWIRSTVPNEMQLVLYGRRRVRVVLQRSPFLLTVLPYMNGYLGSQMAVELFLCSTNFRLGNQMLPAYGLYGRICKHIYTLIFVMYCWWREMRMKGILMSKSTRLVSCDEVRNENSTYNGKLIL